MFRARTGHILKVENSRISDQLNKTIIYSEKNGMKLNLEKTKLMLFNPCVSKDFMPEISINNTRLDVVEQSKLLGVIISSDLKWEANTQYIARKCNSRIWTIRRLKKMGASKVDLVDIYCKQIRSLLEYAALVWSSSLTGEDKIVLGDEYSSYTSALKTTGLSKLSDRRRKLSITFAKKARMNSKFSNWFQLNPKRGGRTNQPQFCPAVAKTNRFEKSPISELINLLNSQ